MRKAGALTDGEAATHLFENFDLVREVLPGEARQIAELECKIGQQQVVLDFFSTRLVPGQGDAPADRRTWGHGIYVVIQAMSGPLSQGEFEIEGMCRLAGVSRAGYYRHWQASAPRREPGRRPLRQRQGGELHEDPGRGRRQRLS